MSIDYSKIPAEYLDSTHDFGFSAVDDPIEVDETASQVTEEITGAITATGEGVTRLENKIDMLLDAIAGQSAEIEERKQVVEAEVKEKLEQVEQLMMPLLVNLLKSSDKEYIRWANREEAVQKQIDKLLLLTRG
jgi:hypothetical protein